MRLFTCIYPSELALDHLELAVQYLPTTIEPRFLSGDSATGRRGDLARNSHGKRGHHDQIRWIPSELRHITLAFHGSVPNSAVPRYVEALEAAIQDVESFEASLGGGGSFGGRTLWIGVAHGVPQIRRLANLAVDTASDASIQSDNRAGGRPHLSLARATSRNSALPLEEWVHALVLYRGPLFIVDTIHVVESELEKGRHGGPRYNDIATLKLNPNPSVFR